jgi:hypothetical protein
MIERLIIPSRISIIHISVSQPGVRESSGVRGESQWVRLIFIILRNCHNMTSHNSLVDTWVFYFSFFLLGTRVEKGWKPLI